MKDCDAVADNMLAYQNLYNVLEGDFNDCELNHVARANNKEADELANIGSTRGTAPPCVFLERINHRSIKIAKPLDPSPPTAGAKDAALAEQEAIAITAGEPEQVLLVKPVCT